MQRAALYARVSTDGQQKEGTIESQLAELRKQVAAAGHELVKVFGRRADAEHARDRALLVPGIEAVGLHADGDVEIEPDLHAELLRQIGGGSQLPVGGPLHEFDEFDFTGVRALAQGSASGFVRLPPLLRPFPPRLADLPAKEFERCIKHQDFAVPMTEFIKCSAPILPTRPNPPFPKNTQSAVFCHT